MQIILRTVGYNILLLLIKLFYILRIWVLNEIWIEGIDVWECRARKGSIE